MTKTAPRNDDLIDRAILDAVRRLPGWVIAAAALIMYPGIGLILPVARHWSGIALVEANLVGTVVAASLLTGWLIVQIEARDRRHLVEWTTELRLLTAQEFEWLVGELFRREGWEVSETGRQDGPDGNIDLELRRQGRRKIVQCKRWTSQQVGISEIRELAGTLLREGLLGEAGIFVTLSDFTQPASTEAKKTGMSLIDRSELFRRIEKVRRSEPCPICSAPMVLDRSQYGWWEHCVVAGCRGKRDLGDEPGRAVEFLTAA
jgi:restriction system protein